MKPIGYWLNRPRDGLALVSGQEEPPRALGDRWEWMRDPFPPASVVKAAMAPLVWLAKHRGLAERYLAPSLSPAPAV